MTLSIDVSGCSYRVDPGKWFDLSIPLRFNSPQPNSYDLPLASAKAWEGDGVVGDTGRGGSCNFDEVRLVPHCNGTHTECVGHISTERISILRTLSEALIPATVISIKPLPAEEFGESYAPEFEPGDRCITRRALDEALNQVDRDFFDALVIRTLPNDESKLTRRYLEQPPPFFTREAMTFLNELQVRHLLVDFPSLDRTFDKGLLTAHHLFWNIPEGSHDVSPTDHSLKTVTEFIYVPERVSDDKYLLNLQIAPFDLDAAPSRPVLFTLEAA